MSEPDVNSLAKAAPFLCPRCAADPQPANFGQPRKCAFTSSGAFTPDNWNCATLSLIRHQRYDDHVRNDDETVAVAVYPDGSFEPATLTIPPMQALGNLEAQEIVPECFSHIVLSFYKDRGTVKSALMLGRGSFLIPLTFAVAVGFADAIAAVAEATEKANPTKPTDLEDPKTLRRLAKVSHFGMPGRFPDAEKVPLKNGDRVRYVGETQAADSNGAVLPRDTIGTIDDETLSADAAPAPAICGFRVAGADLKWTVRLSDLMRI